MAVLNGNNVRLRVNGLTISSNSSCSLSFSNSLVSATKGITNGYDEYIPGVRTGTISFDGFFDFDVTQIPEGTELDWSFNGDRLLYAGRGFLESREVSASSDELGLISGSIKFTGDFETLEVSPNQTLCDDNFTLCDNGTTLCSNL